MTTRLETGYYDCVRSDVRAVIPAGARRVIDVGCGSGGLGAALKRERPHTEVRGIEIVPEQAQRAKGVLDDAVCASAEAPPPSAWPAPDCVIFADVLEHLVDPWTVLEAWRARITPGGWLVASIPNIGHRTVMRGLFGGTFRYEAAGILDRTHLRFFTRSSALELVTRAGFRVVSLTPLRDRDGAASRLAQRAHDVLSRPVLAFAADLDTVQFLIVAQTPG